MSIKASLSSDGLEELYTARTLKEMCLYKCLTNKEILTQEVDVDEEMDGSEKLDWEKYRLKEPLQMELVEALLDAGEKYLFMLTPKYEPVLAAIRMSQPGHLVKVHVSNTGTLMDHQLEWLISGGSVKSLDINGCLSLRSGSLDAINKVGSKLEYLRIGNCSRILPNTYSRTWEENSPILRTPNLKTFIVSEIDGDPDNTTKYFTSLLQGFISNLEDLQISRIDEFLSVDFLEPARSKLTSLTLRNCVVPYNANAWASLLKLDKLRFLDVVGSSIQEAFVGEKVVQLLLTAMPNLTSLVVDPGLVKNIYVDTSIRGQGSRVKRLEFLCSMEDDPAELRKAKLLANEVAHFGTFEGELRILEFYSHRLSSGYLDSTLKGLFEIFDAVSHTPPYKTVALISLLLKTVKSNGVSAVYPDLFFRILHQLLPPDMSMKLGEVLLEQIIGAISTFMRKWFVVEVEDEDTENAETEMINDAICIIMNLDRELCFDHYATVVPILMRLTEEAMMNSVFDGTDMDDIKYLLKNIARLLKKVVERFPGEINALWGISSVPIVIKQLKDAILVSATLTRYDLIHIFGSLITSLKKLCLNSGPRREAFRSADGVDIVMELLTEIIDGCLGLADRDSFDLLEILKSILQDTELDLYPWESGMIASDLEKLLFSLHSKWEFWKPDPVREITRYYQLENIASLLNILDTDRRYDYKASADVKEIMTKLK